MSVVIQKHLEAIAASMALLNAQLNALRFEVNTPPHTPVQTGEERCQGVEEDQCAMREAEWRSITTMGGAPRVMCLGCGYERAGGGTGD